MTVFISMFRVLLPLPCHFPFFLVQISHHLCSSRPPLPLDLHHLPRPYVQYLPDGPSRDRGHRCFYFSPVSRVLCAMDVACTWKHYKLRNISCYVHTLPGLLKILESAVACAIFVFLSSTSLPAPAGPEVVRGRVLHLLGPGSRGHAAEAEWLGEQTAPPAAHFSSGADPALSPSSMSALVLWPLLPV